MVETQLADGPLVPRGRRAGARHAPNGSTRIGKGVVIEGEVKGGEDLVIDAITTRARRGRGGYSRAWGEQAACPALTRGRATRTAAGRPDLTRFSVPYYRGRTDGVPVGGTTALVSVQRPSMDGQHLGHHDPERAETRTL